MAILLVLLFHTRLPIPRPFWYEPIKWVAASGWAGVDLFFVLSGFLIGGLLFRERERTGVIDAPRFLIRRAFKTLPTYYIFLGVFAVTYILFGVKYEPTAAARQVAIVRSVWPALIHLQNYYADQTAILGWLWSLAVEEHFYLFLSLTLAILSRRQPMPGILHIPGFWPLFAGIALACPLARALNSLTLNAPSGASHLRFDSLFAGVALVYWVRIHAAKIPRLTRLRWFVLVLGIVLFFLPRILPGQPTSFPGALGQSVLAVACTLLVLAAYLWDSLAEGPSSGRLRHPWLRVRSWVAWIGIRSYSIYVWHGWFSRPIAHRLTRGTSLDPNGPGTLAVVGEIIFIVVAIGLGSLSFCLIESPFIALRERWFGHQSRPPGAPRPPP